MSYVSVKTPRSKFHIKVCSPKDTGADERDTALKSTSSFSFFAVEASDDDLSTQSE